MVYYFQSNSSKVGFCSNLYFTFGLELVAYLPRLRDYVHGRNSFISEKLLHVLSYCHDKTALSSNASKFVKDLD